MLKDSNILRRLAEKFASLPGIGMKSAWRLAFYILTLSESEVKDFSQILIDAHTKIRKCKLCQNLTDSDLCEVCANKNRDVTLVCVVENSKDVLAFEQSKSFNGLYHVLHGLISPMDGIGPNDLTIKQLISRIKLGKIKEVIMATNPTIEGDATAMYISKLLKPLGILVSRLAYGVPVGSELQYADEMTISKALEFRNIL